MPYMKKNRLFLVLTLIAAMAVSLQAQVKSDNILSAGKHEFAGAQDVKPAPVMKGTQMMYTHSASQTIAGGTVACVNQATGYTSENHYIRAYNLFGEFNVVGRFYVTAVEFGIENAESGAGAGQPVSVELYTLSGNMLFANMTLLAKKDTTILDTANVNMMVPINAIVEQGQILIVDIHIPNGATDEHAFFLGSNNLGETAPSYLAAAGCGVENPVTYSSIGYPDINLIINVYGDVSAGIEDVTPISIQSWPNPATDMLYMDMPQGLWTVELLNVNGQRILQAEVSGQGSLDVSQLPAGMYILRATDGTRLMQDKVFIR